MPTITIDPKYILSAKFATMLCDSAVYYLFQHYELFTLAFFISQNDILPTELTRAVFNHVNNTSSFNEEQVRQKMRLFMNILPNNHTYTEQTPEERNIIVEQLCLTLQDAFNSCKQDIQRLFVQPAMEPAMQPTTEPQPVVTIYDQNVILEDWVEMNMNDDLNTGMIIEDDEYTVADFEALEFPTAEDFPTTDFEASEFEQDMQDFYAIE